MSINTENRLTVAQGEFELNRLPKRPLELLRAWDAADEYLLKILAEDLQPSADARILIVNDSFGALAVALSTFQPQAVSDSYLSQEATRLNLLANNLPEHSVKFINSLEPLEGQFDLVLIKVPKTLALLEDQLIRLHPHLLPSTQIIVAGMIKTLPSSVWKLLERLVGPTTTALARKKARLIFAASDPDLIIPVSPYPVCYQLEESDYLISNHANVFSRDSLDIGTRFFLQHLPSRQDSVDIIDLGCGNGLLGLMAAELNPAATVHFVDESFMAVASAKENFYRAFGQTRNATFRVSDGLKDFELASADIILCNPPFHQHNTIGDQLANSMFNQSKKVLRNGGQLWIIGNRHLNYQVNLNRLFGGHTVVAANAKFIILKATQKILT
ncbi:methyltransferase [Methylobacter psychrophilus]|uniref:methyltransferase n=1 Tax=Methylobacter psychrophilus TaxID=96941 RepID=UPI0021D4882A|nr:methyltransferase [Methylobacter psychrophilus]